MKYIQLRSFDNYIQAHMTMGKLKDYDIACWLKDEYSVTIDPFLSNAIGGIKLMVAEEQAAEASELLESFE